ncbi:MAG: hypothetical protein ABIH28_00880 [archaeon]
MKKSLMILFLCLFLISFVSAGLWDWITGKATGDLSSDNLCEDGTPVDSCSSNKPKYCKQVQCVAAPCPPLLIDDCQACGCPSIQCFTAPCPSYVCESDGTCGLSECTADSDCKLGYCSDGSTYKKYSCSNNKCVLINYVQDPCQVQPKCSSENEMCGGIAGIQCCSDLTCKLDGDYPDAAGKCINVQPKCSSEKEFCGGIVGVHCCSGLTCEYDGHYPDAGGVCVKEIAKEIKPCDGCLDKDNNCLPFGIRTSTKYCDIDKELKNQLSGENLCNNNYECKSNLCIDQKCTELGLFRKIIRWAQELFGLD